MGEMTFPDAVLRAAKNPELLRQYDRLNGTNLSGEGSGFAILIDTATGRVESEVPGFVQFVWDTIWMPFEHGFSVQKPPCRIGVFNSSWK